MKIKDVEKLTGLTAKSIRHYEAKGLLEVQRNEENSYREYSEEHVNQLRLIKLFRYLDFRIEEIADILRKSDMEIKEVFREKAELFSEQKEDCENKQEICLALAKDYKNNPETILEYNETIEFMESEEMEELNEKIKNCCCPNLISTIAATCVFTAPVLWLFYNMKAEKWDMLFANAICALVGTILVTLNWVHYITQYRRHKNRVKKNNRKWLWMGLVTIGAAVVALIAMVGVLIMAEMLIMSKDYLFFEHDPVAGKIMIYLIIIPIMLIFILLAARLSKKSSEEVEDMNDMVFIWNHLGRCRGLVIALWAIGIYCCVTNVTIVTEDAIICCSPLCPAGTRYQYSDVESIKTGFGEKSFAFVEYKRKGSFYYQFELDGKTIVFSQPSVNQNIARYEEDTYLELEEFDQALVSLGISKVGNNEGYKNCDFDEEYVQRFIRIIELR